MATLPHRFEVDHSPAYHPLQNTANNVLAFKLAFRCITLVRFLAIWGLVG